VIPDNARLDARFESKRVRLLVSKGWIKCEAMRFYNSLIFRKFLGFS
jgi:hypothetical protein